MRETVSRAELVRQKRDGDAFTGEGEVLCYPRANDIALPEAKKALSPLAHAAVCENTVGRSV